MHHHIVGTVGVLMLASPLISNTANAQERNASSYFSEQVAVPSHALELNVGTGYTQGFGMVAPGRGVPSVAGAGLGANLAIDYRLNPHWSIGLESQYQEFVSEDNASSRGLSGNVGATYHFAPAHGGDPWVRLGTGYRFLWENDPAAAPGITVVRHGLELAAVKVGYDVRLSEDVAIAPVIGADVNLFLWQDGTGSGNHALASAQAGTFVYAGLQGRFDIGGQRSGPTTTREITTMVSTGAVIAPSPPPPPPPPVSVEVIIPVTPSLAISQEIMKACALDLGAIDKAPKFEFNQTELLQSDMDVLTQVAACFSTGPMKGMELELVGRADPRGSVGYNEELGMKRANNVAAFIENLGVHASQLDQSSRGKLDATGHDEATWAIDRRVDLVRRH